MPLIRSRFYHWLPNVADLTYVVIQGPAQVIRLWHEVKKKDIKTSCCYGCCSDTSRLIHSFEEGSYAKLTIWPQPRNTLFILLCVVVWHPDVLLSKFLLISMHTCDSPTHHHAEKLHWFLSSSLLHCFHYFTDSHARPLVLMQFSLHLSFDHTFHDGESASFHSCPLRCKWCKFPHQMMICVPFFFFLWSSGLGYREFML